MKNFFVVLGLLGALNSNAEETRIIAAVSDLQCEEGISQSASRMLSGYLRSYIVNTKKFVIVAREDMEQILKEQAFQLSGCVSDKCIVQIGQLLGTQKMFAGSISKPKGNYIIKLRMIDVATGIIEKEEEEKCFDCVEGSALDSLKEIANRICGQPSFWGSEPRWMQGSAGGWDIQTLDNGKNNADNFVPAPSSFYEGSHDIIASIAIDKKDFPRICYSYNSKYTKQKKAILKYGSWNGSSWDKNTVDEDHDSNYDSIYIIIDAEGASHIFYSGNNGIKHARWTGSSWDIKTIDSAVRDRCSFKMGPNRLLHIVYYDTSDHALKYSCWNGASWNSRTIDNKTDAVFPSIDVDKKGFPHISYCDTKNQSLKYAHWTGSSWNIQAVDTDCMRGPREGGMPCEASITTDSMCRPLIVYSCPSFYEIRYARPTGLSWCTKKLFIMLNVMSMRSLVALDSKGSPNILFENDLTTQLNYTRFMGSSWFNKPLDDNDSQEISFILDTKDNPHIVYYDRRNCDFKYATLDHRSGK